jgi:hypothetical protein
MNLLEIFSRPRTLYEGGNLELDNPNDPSARYQADEIDLKVHNRTFMVGLLDKLLQDINVAFYKQNKKPLWNPQLLQSKEFLGGSSLHFFDTKGISDKEFAKHKPKVGDIDTQVNKELEPTVEQFLTAYDHKQIGDATLLGYSKGNEQFNALFQFQDPPIKIQIDFEFGKYDEKTDMPDEWYRFSHSSEWNDIQAGIKGVFHKYLYRALTSAHGSIKHQVDVKKTKTNIKPNVADNDLSFAVASGQGGGLSQKYEPYIHTDPATGEKKTHDQGVPYKRLIPSGERKYIQKLDQQFFFFFGAKPEGNDSQLQKSFLGTLDLINKYITDQASKENVFRAFLTLCLEPGAQMISKNDPERDQEIKFAAIDNFIQKCKLKNLRPEAVKMSKEYVDDFKEVQDYKSKNPNEKQPRAALKRMKAGLAEGKEKFNYELYQKGFHFEQEIGGVTYKVYNKKGGSDNIKIDALDQKNRVIGHASFWRHQYKDGLESLGTSVEPAWQGKGIATNMYAVMRMLGVNIHPASMQSNDGKKMWSKWNKQGDAHHLKGMNPKMSEGLNEAEVKAQLRKGMPHLHDLKAADFLDLLDELHDGNGKFKLENIPLNVKVDGFGGRFGKNAEGKPFMGTSRTEPRYQASFVDYHQKKGTTDPEILGRAQMFDDLFGEMMKAIKLVDSKLGPDFLVNKQVTCEVLFLPFATETPEGKLKFVGIHYDKLPKGVQLALVPFHAVEADSGDPVEDPKFIDSLLSVGNQGSVMFINNRLTQKEGLDVTEIINPLENIEELKSIVSGTAGKRDRASLQLRKEVEEKLLPIKEKLEQVIIKDPNIIGKDMLGKDYEGIVINSRLGPIKVTSQEQRDVITAKQAAKTNARTERPRGENKTAVVAIGSFVGHKGHEELFDYTIKKAAAVGGDPYLFIGNAVGKNDPIPPDVKVQTWHKMYPQYAKNISTTQQGGSLMQKIKHELINPLPGKPPRYDNVIIMVGEDQQNMPIAQALMKAVNKFEGYEHVKVSLEATPRGTGMSFTKLRNILKDANATPEQQYAVWAQGFDVKKLGREWIMRLMELTRKGMGIGAPVKKGIHPDAAQPVKLPQQKAPAETMAGVGMQDAFETKCWKGYKKAGTKMKGGKRVNNCVPVSEDVENLIADFIKLLERK